MAKKQSEWRRTFDACPDRSKHLADAILAAAAADTDGTIDKHLGLEAIVSCLAQTYSFTVEDSQSLREEAERCWDGYLYSHAEILPRYEGGDPRIWDEFGELAWPSMSDLEDVAEDLGEELESSRGVFSLTCGASSMEPWVWRLGEDRIEDVGYLTREYYDDDACRTKEYVWRTWTPAGDEDARREAVLATFGAWYDESQLGADNWVLSAADPALLVDCLMRNEVTDWQLHVVVQRAVAAVSLPTEIWEERGSARPDDPWWSAPNVETGLRRCEEDPVFRRQVVAAYSALHLEDVLGEQYDADNHCFFHDDDEA